MLGFVNFTLYVIFTVRGGLRVGHNNLALPPLRNREREREREIQTTTWVPIFLAGDLDWLLHFLQPGGGRRPRMVDPDGPYVCGEFFCFTYDTCKSITAMTQW